MLKILWFVYLLKELGITHTSWRFWVIAAPDLVTLLIVILVLIFVFLK